MVFKTSNNNNQIVNKDAVNNKKAPPEIEIKEIVFSQSQKRHFFNSKHKKHIKGKIINFNKISFLKRENILNTASFCVMCAVVLGCILANKSLNSAMDFTYANATLSEMNTAQQVPIFNVKTDEKKIALTFNAAWENEDIPALLKKLENLDVKLTFFIVGDFAKQYPDSVKQIADAGHEIANHSYSHPHVANMSVDEIVADMQMCDNLLKQITGQEISLYRAPYGEFNKNVVAAALKNNHQCIQWNIDSRDWKNLTPSQIEENIIKNATPGSIVLFHTNKENTFDAIENVVNKLKENGYTICKVSDLIYKENYSVDSEGKQYLN